MCCYHSKELTEKFLSKHRNHQYVTAYKLIRFYENYVYGLYGKNVSARYLCTPYQYVKIEPGLYKSSSKKSNYYRRNHTAVSHGIHTFLSQADAQEYCDTRDRIVIAVKAEVKDLLSVGGFDRYVHNWSDKGINLVFKQIIIPESEYKRACRKFGILEAK